MHRTVKSFVLRGGRVSNRQQYGLDNALKKYELPLPGEPYNLDTCFNTRGDVIVEIGFGMGKSLIQMAKQQPENNFIGIEVHQAGIGSLAADIEEQCIDNIRIISGDAVEAFKKYFMHNALAGVQIFFPDPWHKKRHNKRRLIQPEFVNLLVERLRCNGFIHCATDWENYAEHMLQVLSAHPQLQNISPHGGYIPKPDMRPLTKFEQRGAKLGHGVWDLFFCKM